MAYSNIQFGHLLQMPGPRYIKVTVTDPSFKLPTAWDDPNTETYQVNTRTRQRRIQKRTLSFLDKVIPKQGVGLTMAADSINTSRTSLGNRSGMGCWDFKVRVKEELCMGNWGGTSPVVSAG